MKKFWDKYDYLIVWAWLTGLVLWERLSTQLWKKILIIDKRNHIWWNCYDYRDKETWITIHKYWPHVFHTQDKEVRDYLSKFTEWEPFFYNVKAIIHSREVSLPFNLNSIYQIFSHEFAKKLEWLLINKYEYWKRLVIRDLLDSWDKDLRFLWDFIFKKVFEWYTKKQWWLTTEEIDSSVLFRVPILISKDDSYFQDQYQAIPSKGYTEMMNNIVKIMLIKLLLKWILWVIYVKHMFQKEHKLIFVK
jgi:UDP-galactopyranose mutase